MADTELSSKLYEKMSAEQDKFRAWLVEQPPADILLHAVEYAVREDILMEMEALELPDDQARALLASPDTMADIYKTFSKMADTGHMDVVRESIKDRAATLSMEQAVQEAVQMEIESQGKLEAVYLVDRSSLLHLKEVQGGDFAYTVFDKQTRQKTAEGRISLDDVLDGIDPTHDHLAAARAAAIGAAGLQSGPLGGSDVAQVGLTSLKDFRDSDIRRRSIWEPETLPKDDIRFINSSYDEQFRLPNGGKIEVEYPDRTFSARCEYIDDYHTYVGSEVYHICQFAEVLERGGGVCRPEPVLDAEQAAWKIGWNAYLAVECGAGHWDYHLYDEKFNETKSGELEVVGCSINEVRDMVLFDNKLERRSMTPTDYGMLMDKAAMQEQEAQDEKRESVLGQLSALKSSAKGHTAPAPTKKRDEASL
ncbi:DUF3848 domain-containing protein [uncultured Oscillibacter sp.]|uniref:DUF3848 domain-containing protein n=1 Tax=uncultured Oscillibacter sp. TaxID=876091 RepID=UPI0025D7CD7B|nr:DUF3848 domain-containing protein [uncultured Oscillibacter sp.]